MTVKILTKCTRCGSTEHLETHHISYIPEITKTLCKACNAKERRHSIKGRGFLIAKSYPQQGIIRLPKDTLLSFQSELLEIEKAPISPVAVIFAYNLGLEYLVESLRIVIQDLELRISHRKYIQEELGEEKEK